MRARVIRPFKDSKNDRMHLRKDVISISKSRFEQIGAFYLEAASDTEQLTPKRDSNGICIPCQNKK